jgi:hypothetical protein
MELPYPLVCRMGHGINGIVLPVSHPAISQMGDFFMHDATDNTRGQCTVIFLVGLVCLIPPLTPFGVCFCIASGWTLLHYQPMAAAEENLMVAAKEDEGHGSAWGCVIVLALFIMVVGVAIGYGALLQLADAGVIR